jgi:lipoprotein-anchoring transpeptidase ErfK/SrfK
MRAVPRCRRSPRRRHDDRRGENRHRAAGGIALTALLVAVASGCGLVSDDAQPPLSADPAKDAGQAATQFALAVTPATGAKNLPVSTEIGIKLAGGRITAVSLTKKDSAAKLKGAVRDDGSAWIPASPLAFATAYTATVTATSTDGARTESRTTRFTTMSRPGRETDTGLYLLSDQTYGVAMPVVVQFDPPVPASARAGVQRRLFVVSKPPQPGVWHWASGNEVWYRPPAHWRPGTTLTVRAALAGHPTGNGHYGDTDRAATVRIGGKVLLDIDNKRKRMSVYVADKLIRKIPVSLGKPSTPSSSGSLVVMSKEYSTIFDTTREGPGGYRVSVNYAMRLTWGGEYIHAAPWSVGDQGIRNVSHGCVNLSTSNAEWLFGVTHVGDPVVVRGTEVRVTDGNGWTAWNLPWPQYIKGSALPVPRELAAGSVATTPTPTASPAPTASPGR